VNYTFKWKNIYVKYINPWSNNIYTNWLLLQLFVINFGQTLGPSLWPSVWAASFSGPLPAILKIESLALI